jgi:hypothetical protein
MVPCACGWCLRPALDVCGRHGRVVTLRVWLCAVVLTAACSDSPTAPSPPAVLDLSGQWRGGMTILIDGFAEGLTLTSVDLTQRDLAITGSFTAVGSLAGTFSGALASLTPGAALSVRVDFTTPSSQPPTRCTGVATAAGTATLTAIQISAPVVSVANCDGLVSGMSFSLRR